MEFDLHGIKETNIRDIFRPLLTPNDHQITKRHISSQIDLALGFKIKQIEEILQMKAKAKAPGLQFDRWGPVLHDGAQTWVGLDFQVLQTTYHDLKTIFEVVKPQSGDKIIDLGAGYGRLGVFQHFFYPRTSFLGLELVNERVVEGNRILTGLNSFDKKMQTANLGEIKELPEGDIYFIYDFGSIEHINKILGLLKNTPKKMLVVKGKIAHQQMLKDEDYGEGVKVKKLEDVYLY